MASLMSTDHDAPALPAKWGISTTRRGQGVVAAPRRVRPPREARAPSGDRLASRASERQNGREPADQPIRITGLRPHPTRAYQFNDHALTGLHRGREPTRRSVLHVNRVVVRHEVTRIDRDGLPRLELVKVNCSVRRGGSAGYGRQLLSH